MTPWRMAGPVISEARLARRCHTIHIRAGKHTLTAEHQLPPDLSDALVFIK